MKVETFFKQNLDSIKELIAKELNNEFDSHEFVRCFAKKFQIEYVRFLIEHEEEPFRNVHLQIGKCLSKNVGYLNLKKGGKVSSSNIFGNKTESELWNKLIL